MLVEFMQTQDKRSAHQEKCIGEMSQQVGKLAKAVEGLCGALGPAMRDSINGTLGGEVRHLKDVADEVRRAAGDLSAAASAVRSHPPPQVAYPPYQTPAGPPGSPLGSPIPPGMPSGVAARHDAALLATALVPEIEHIVAEALAKSLAFAGQHGQSEGQIGSIDARLMAAKTPSIRARPATTADRAPAASTNANEFGAAAEARRKEEEEAAARDRRAMDEGVESETKAKTGEEEEWKAKEREKEKKEREKEREKEKEKERERRSTSGEKVNSKALTEDEVKKIHSAIRWNKPLGELAGLIVGPEQANCEDPRNGNRPLHIASQNGFTPICKLLVAKGAEINAVNGKGNTGLHMALGYDYDECAEFLFSCGADGSIVNSEGHAGKNGLEGDKGPDGYVAPLAELREARTVDESMAALRRITKEGLGNDDKAALVQCGLLKKKNFPDSWTQQVQDAFRELMMSL